jgi:hypothetical protein
VAVPDFCHQSTPGSGRQPRPTTPQARGLLPDFSPTHSIGTLHALVHSSTATSSAEIANLNSQPGETTMSTLTIKDLLPPDIARQGEQTTTIRPLSRAELRSIRGGRAVVVTVDGGSTATVDDFSINMDIFMGNIKGSYI